MGFTILELLISSALLSVLLLVTWGTYITASRSMNSVMGRFEIFFKVISFRRAFIRSVEGVSPYPQFGNSKANFKGTATKLSFTTLSAPFPSTTSETVRISELRWVTFDKSPAGGHFIKQDPYFFLTDRSTKKNVAKKEFPELQKWKFQYHDGKSWSSAWDYSLKRKLPKQIRIKYTIKSEERGVEDLITVAIAQEAEPFRANGANPFAGTPPPTQGQPGQQSPPPPGPPERPSVVGATVNPIAPNNP